MAITSRRKMVPINKLHSHPVRPGLQSRPVQVPAFLYTPFARARRWTPTSMMRAKLARCTRKLSRHDNMPACWSSTGSRRRSSLPSGAAYSGPRRPGRGLPPCLIASMVPNSRRKSSSKTACGCDLDSPCLGLPDRCDGCGQRFLVSHAMTCKKGGLMLLRQNNNVAPEWHHPFTQVLFSPAAVSKKPLIHPGRGGNVGAAPF
jgi:hypothetical protein